MELSLRRSARAIAAAACAMTLVACGTGVAVDDFDAQVNDAGRCEGAGCPPDAGPSPSASDASAPLPDAGAPPPDASEITPDAGTPPADAATPTPDASTSGADAASPGGPDAGPIPATSASCATAPLRSTGTVYYYCDCATGASSGCIAGDDTAGDGSAANPYRSFSAAMGRFRSMNAGDTVALCRGGAWDITDNGGYWENPNCRGGVVGESNPAWPAPDDNPDTCDFRDYVPAAHPAWAADQTKRPIVNHSGLNVFFTRQYQGNRLWNLDLRAPDTNAGGEGVLRLSGGAYTDVCNTRIHLGSCAVRLATRYNVLGDGHDVVVRHSQISEHQGSSVMGGVKNLLLDSNVFTNNGHYGSGSRHTIYLGNDAYAMHPDYPSRNMIIRNNVVTTDSRCEGVMLVFHAGLIDGVTIENNLISTTSTHGGCFGVMVSSGNAYDEFVNFRVARNRIASPGAAISLSMCRDCEVSDNIVTSGNVELGVQGCNWEQGVVDPATWFWNSCNRNVRVLNNTVYGAGSINFRGKQDRAAYNAWTASCPGTCPMGIPAAFTDDPGYVVANNVVWRSSAGACQSTSSWTAPDSASWEPIFAVNSNNYCRAGTGDAESAVFVDAPAGDFTPVSPGPLIGAGTTAAYSPLAIGSAQWSATDLGSSRTPPIDRGALLHGP